MVVPCDHEDEGYYKTATMTTFASNCFALQIRGGNKETSHPPFSLIGFAKVCHLSQPPVCVRDPAPLYHWPKTRHAISFN